MTTPPSLLSGPLPGTGSIPAIGRRVRRAVLRRRRLLAAACASVAVVAGLQAAGPAPAVSEVVLVAGRDLPAGTVLSESDVTEASYADGTAPDDLLTDPVGEILAAPVRRGEPLTDVRFVGPSLTQGRSDLVALPIRLPDAGMVELLAVGDVIDLVAADPQSGDGSVAARGVEVLALPAADTGESAGFSGGAAGLTGRLVILGVSVSDVGDVTASAVRSYVTFTWGSR